MIRMKRARIVLSILAVSTTLGRAQVIEPSFWTKFWWSDEIAVGRVVAVDEWTVEVQVQEWLRDTTGKNSKTIRVPRYAIPACYPRAAEPYELGSRYVFLMRTPYLGGGPGPDWTIRFQLQLNGSGLCFRGEHGASYYLADRTGLKCLEVIDDEVFLDALRTFQGCFHLHVDDLSRLTVDMSCTQRRLRKWSARSPLHEYLATSAIAAIERPDH
jgi:hypothetical protein